jgi:D-alanine-D-alanine ligase
LVLYNATTGVMRGLETDELPDNDDAAMQIVTAALESFGHRVTTFGVSYDNLDALESIDTEMVFNMCEGSGVDGHVGVEVPDLLERRGIAFTGANASFYDISSGKFRTKMRLAAAKVPVPLGAVMPSPDLPVPQGLRFPLFVKPRDAYGSLGVSDRSLVHDAGELRAQVATIVRECNTHALVEQYIDGREISVGLIGPWQKPMLLPPLEVCFGKAYDGRAPIRSFQTKHDPSSPLYHDFQIACPAALTEGEDRRVREVALRAYRAVRGNGYGRVDIRLAKDGTPYVLEVNANCSLEWGPLDSDCGLMVLMARAAGLEYDAFLHHLVLTGLVPLPSSDRVPAAPRWSRGRIEMRALDDLREGERLMPFGPTYPAERDPNGFGTMLTASGTRVFVEPHIRCIGHSSEPNLGTVVEESLFLEALRPIRRGEDLTLDWTRPLSGSTPAARTCGRRVRWQTRSGSLALSAKA